MSMAPIDNYGFKQRLKAQLIQEGNEMTNVRIARKIATLEGAVIRWEVLGEFFSPPRSMDYIRRELAEAQAEEPHAGWELQTRGTERGWHKWEEA